MRKPVFFSSDEINAYCANIVQKHEVLPMYREDVIALMSDAMNAAFTQYPDRDIVATTISMLENFKDEYGDQRNIRTPGVSALVLVLEADIAIDLLTMEA